MKIKKGKGLLVWQNPAKECFLSTIRASLPHLEVERANFAPTNGSSEKARCQSIQEQGPRKLIPHLICSNLFKL